MKNLLIKTPSNNSTIFLLIITVCFCIYFPMLSGGFKTMDDEISITKNQDLRSITNIPQIFSKSFFNGNTYYRPLVTFSFLIEYQFIGLNPFFYNLDNLILHALNAFLIFLIIFSIKGDRTFSFATAFLFAIHPVHWEAVTNIAGRSILLCSLIFLSAFYLYQQYRETGKKGCLILCLASFFLSLLSKESAAVFPAVILAYEVFIKKTKIFSKSLLFNLSLVGAILIFYAFIRRELGMTNIYLWPDIQSGILGFITFLRSFITYLRLSIWPVDLHFDRARLYFQHIANIELWITLLVYGILIAGILRTWKSWKDDSKFYLAWVTINFLTVCQLTPVVSHYSYAATAEHFLYLPSIGIMAGLVLAAKFILKEVFVSELAMQTKRIAVLGAFLFLMSFTIAQSFNSANEVAMFSRTLLYDPANTRIRSSYGLALAKRGAYAEAEKQFRICLDAEPWSARDRISLGKSLFDQEKYWEAIQEYEIVQDPGDLAGLLKDNLSIAYQTMINRYAQRLAMDSQNPDLHYSLGVMYSKTHQLELAQAEYLQCLAINPAHRNALFNLASTYQAQGLAQKAIDFYTRLVNLDKDKDALDDLAEKNIKILQKAP